MTVVLGKPGWLTSEQVRRLDRAGMTIGPHTYDHHGTSNRRGAANIRPGRPTGVNGGWGGKGKVRA